MSLGQQVATSLKQTALFRFSGQLLTWIGTLFIVRLLSPDDYGLIAMAMFPIAVLSIVLDFGMSASVVRSGQVDPDELAQIMGAIRIGGFVVFASVLLLAPVIAWAFREPRLTTVLSVMAVTLLIQAWLALPEALMRRSMRFVELSQVEFWGAIAGVVLALCLALAGAGVWALVGGILAPGIVKAVAFKLIGIEQVVPVYAVSKLGKHLQYGRYATGSALIWICWSASDAAIVGSVLGSTAAGLYAMGRQISTLTTDKLMPLLNQVLFSAFASIQDDAKRVEEQTRRSMRLLLVMAVPLGWGLAAVAPEFVSLVLGPKWTEAAPLVRAFCLVAPLGMMGSLSSSIAQSLGRADIAFLGALTSFAAIPASLFAAARLGGLDLVMLMWLAIYPLVVLVNLRRELPVAGVTLVSLLAQLWPAALAGLVMLGNVYGAGVLVGHDGPIWLRLMILVSVGAATYLPLMYLLDRHSMLELYRIIRTKTR